MLQKDIYALDHARGPPWATNLSRLSRLFLERSAAIALRLMT